MAQSCNPELGCWLLSKCEEVLDKYICDREPVLYLTGYTGFVFALIPILIGIGILGGLGGGMMKRPVLNLLLNYNNSTSNAITNGVIFASGLFNAGILFFEKHTDHPMLPLINFDIAIIFNLAIPIAWTLGQTISSTIPTMATYIFQLLFLIIAIPILWKLTLTEKKLEADKRSQKILIIEKIKTIEEITSELSLDEKQAKRYKVFYETNHSRVQWKSLLIIFTGFVLNQLVLFMRATKNHVSIVHVQQCSTGNGLMIFVLMLVNIGYTSGIYFFKRNEEYLKNLVHYRPEERYYTPMKQFFSYYLGGFLAGFFAGFVGMGAGIIMVTVQLKARIIAREAAATSAFSYFMISLNGLIQVIEMKTLPWSDELTFMGMAILGVLIFTKPAYIYMNKFKIGYIVLVLDIFQEMFNIIAIIFLIVINSYLYGINSLVSIDKRC